MNATAVARPAVGWQYWTISILSLLWNAFGGYDYVMTRTRNSDYLAQMGDPTAMLAWIDRFPIWASVAWGLGVWGSVAGSILLLMRSRHAVTAFAVSLAGAVVSFAAQMMNPLPPELGSPGQAMIMPLVIVAVVVLLWWFARRAQARGQIS